MTTHSQSTIVNASPANWPKGDPAHTRVPGKCRFPLDADEQWDCPGCIKHRPLAHPDHTYDPLTCRATVAWGRLGRPRKGSHPRQPAEKASDSEVRGLQAQPPPGQGDLGAQEVQQVADAATASAAVEEPATALPSEMPRRVLPSSVIGLDLMFSPHLPSFEPAQQR